jgi:hypothetical protein
MEMNQDILIRKRINGRKFYSRLKKEIIQVYGCICQCCGESNPTLLTIDHINGGGDKHRKEVGSHVLYPWLKKNGYPKDNFQLLCWNCNCTKGHFGCCPHDPDFEIKNTISKTNDAFRKRKNKIEVIDHYGGKCFNCGINNILFLTIHHINNDGAQHRREMKIRDIYQWVKRNNFPEDIFQILCYNCNCSKSILFKNTDINRSKTLVWGGTDESAYRDSRIAR